MKKETKHEILGITKIRTEMYQKRKTKQIQKDNVYLENAFANKQLKMKKLA